MAEQHLQVGDVAPDFTLIDDQGKSVTLSQLHGQRIILYFYPKDDTPGCTAQACGFRDVYTDIEESHAIVFGISADNQESHVRFKTKYNLPFQLLMDENHAVADLYGVWGEKSMYGRTFEGMTRSHFVVDEKGILVDVQYKVSPTDSISKALAAITE